MARYSTPDYIDYNYNRVVMDAVDVRYYCSIDFHNVHYHGEYRFLKNDVVGLSNIAAVVLIEKHTAAVFLSLIFCHLSLMRMRMELWLHSY